MKNLFKKTACLLLVGILSTACACGATGGTNSSSGSESVKESFGESVSSPERPVTPEGPNYTLDSYDFSTVFIDHEEVTLKKYDETALHEDECVVYNVSSRIGDKNYLKFDIETDVDLVGFINYHSIADQSVRNSEKFFIRAGSTEFRTFLDAFRKGAKGDFGKIISTISFQSVDETKEGRFVFHTLGVNDRIVDTYEDWHITNGDMEIGTSPFYGGCVTYLEKLDQDVYEYMDFDGNIVIDRYVDPDYDAMQVVSDRVNLINVFDLGREVQPSYYSMVDETNGYKPDYDPDDVGSYYDGLSGVKYNPIQCGDYGGFTPQIIDYTWKEDYLYIKMKAQEWFFSNIQSNGYIEVTYYFDEGGAILVDNVYTDFSCFVGEENLSICTQETPATYFSYPLNYFYCETKQGLIFDDNLSDQNGINQGKASLKSIVSTPDYFYAINSKYMIRDWCAFVNSNLFGVGIFMPNADRYIASRGRKSNNYFYERFNSDYHEDFYTFGDEEIVPSYAAMNYNYINPCLQRKMVDFIPLEYSYALFVGDTTEMKSVFTRLEDDGILTNEHLLDETKGWPRK